MRPGKGSQRFRDKLPPEFDSLRSTDLVIAHLFGELRLVMRSFPMNIQYLGFEQDLKCRRYTFRVIETSKEDREFQLSVENQAVVASKFKFQDIPDLCFSRLKRELACEKSGDFVALQSFVSEIELNQYIAEHYPSKKKRS